jgi:hypothetical protein
MLCWHGLALLQVFLVFGRTGWIGGLVGQYLKEQGATFEYANCRLEDRSAIVAELDRVSSASVGRCLGPIARQSV